VGVCCEAFPETFVYDYHLLEITRRRLHNFWREVSAKLKQNIIISFEKHQLNLS